MSAIQHIICNVREGKSESSLNSCCAFSPRNSFFLPSLIFAVYTSARPTVCIIITVHTELVAKNVVQLLVGSGFAGLFESLASESIFTIAHSILHTGASLGLSLQPMLTSGLRLVQGCVKMAMKIQTMAGPALLLPGGVVGTVLQHFLRAFNLIFFPPLLAVTGGLAGAMGVACLLGVPTVLSEIYNFVSTKVLRGVTAVYKHTQRKSGASIVLVLLIGKRISRLL